MMMTSRQIVDRQKRRGATILEVLVVLAIIAMIAAVVGPRLVGYLGKAKSETAALQIEQIGNALQLFYIDTGRYPSREEGLAVLFTAPAASPDWSGPYLEAEEALSDPWGRAYLYEPPNDNGNNGNFKVESLGRDGVRGGSGEDADLS